MKNVREENGLGDPVVSFVSTYSAEYAFRVQVLYAPLRVPLFASATDRLPVVRLARAKAKEWRGHEKD